MKLLKTISLFIPLVLIGCASVPLADENLDREMKSFSAVTGKARVYVVESGGFLTQHRINFQIFSGKELAGVMSGDTYVVINVSPGKKSLLISSPENQEMLSYVATAGDLIFIGVGSHGGWTQVRVSNLRILDAIEGKEAVNNSKLARRITTE